MADIATADTSTTARMELNSAGTAGSFSSRLETAADQDWIRFEVTSAATWNFFAHFSNVGTEFGDVSLTLRDLNGAVVASSDDEGVGGNSLITQPLSVGVYYLEVSDFFDNDVGSYTLSATSGASTIAQGGATDANDSITAAAAGTYLGGMGKDAINLSALGNDAVGDQGDDTIAGNSLDNRLFGGLGSDTLFGNGGFDTLFGDAGDDSLDGGLSDDELFGGSGDDILAGDDGQDTLVGGDGEDLLTGGLGDDIYRVDAFDTINEVGGEGSNDRVQATMSFALAADDDIETMLAYAQTSATVLNLTGNALVQSITGNAGANILSGLGGDDTLSGLGGNDRLIGGTGKDTQAGGLGNDRFVFSTAADSVVGANRDTIQDFTVAGTTERIDLSAFAGTFAFRGTGAFTSAGKEVAIKFSGANTIVKIDLDGDKAAEMEILLVGHKVLTAGDFYL